MTDMDMDMDMDALLEPVRKNFIERLKDTRLTIADIKESLTSVGTLDGEVIKELKFISHELAGNGKTLGFPKMTDLGRPVEYVCDAITEEGKNLDAEGWLDFGAKIAALLDGVDNLIA